MDKSKRVILSLVAMWSILHMSTCNGNENCFENDVDYPGEDIEVEAPVPVNWSYQLQLTGEAKSLFTTTESAQLCQDLCASTTACKVFTFSTSNKRCYMKKSKPTRTVAEVGAVSGPQKCLAVVDALEVTAAPTAAPTTAAPTTAAPTTKDDVDGALGAGRDFNKMTVDFKGVIPGDNAGECCQTCRQQAHGTIIPGDNPADYENINFFVFGYFGGRGACSCFAKNGFRENGYNFRAATVPEGGTHGQGTPLLTMTLGHQNQQIIDSINSVCSDGCPVVSSRMSRLYSGVC